MSGELRAEFLDLFKYKIKRLEELQYSHDKNDLVETAGLFRDLLLSDENGLFGQIVKLFPELRTKRNRSFIFEVKHLGTTYHDTQNKQGVVTNGNGSVCSHPILKGTVSYSRDDFLKLPILCIGGDHYTFKDIITFVANKLGARHYDNLSGSEKQMLLHDIRSTFKVEKLDPIIIPLYGKASIVIKTANRLIERIDEI